MTKVSFMNIMYFSDFSSMIRTEQGRWVHKQNYIKQTKHAYMANKEAAASGFPFLFSHQMTVCVSDHFLCVSSCVSCPRQLIILSLAPDDIGIVDD